MCTSVISFVVFFATIYLIILCNIQVNCKTFRAWYGRTHKQNLKMAYIRKRERCLIVGNQRGGKSYWFGRMANVYRQNQGSVFVYNYQGEDFPDYYEIAPLDFQEMEEYIIPSLSKMDQKRFKKWPWISHFWYEDVIYPFSDFNRIFCGCGVKAMGMFDSHEDRAFHMCMKKYVSCCWMATDDCRGFFRHGVQKEHINFYSTSDHHGAMSSKIDTRKKGTDTAMMFHHPDHVNGDLWVYSTKLILFKVTGNVTLKKIDEPQLQEVINYAIKDLGKKPDYSYYEIGIKTLDYQFHEPINF